MDKANTIRQGRHDVRWRDDDDVGGDGRHGFGGMVEQRPAVDRLGQLVAAETRGSPAREDDRAGSRERRPRSRPASNTRRCPRTRHVAGRSAPQDASSVEVLKDRHDVAPAGAGRIAERSGREGFACGQGECLCRQIAVRRHGVGKVLVEDDDPAGALELTDRRGWAAGSRGGLTQRGRREDRQGLDEAIHRASALRVGRRRLVVGRADTVAVPHQAPLGNQLVHKRCCTVRRVSGR